jgi:hypothetical protein
MALAETHALRPRFKGQWPCERIFAQAEFQPMLSWCHTL